MSTEIKYKGSTVKSLEEGETLTLHTDGHKLTGDIVITGGNNGGSSSPSSPTEVTAEEKTVTPTKATQVVTPSNADYLSKVTVNPIPDNYVELSGSIEVTENGITLDISKLKVAKVYVNISTFDGGLDIT